jgi:LysR family hca operon transcriptional activator
VDERHLSYFIAVAEELNFTRAAERLHTVQPSLSAQIRKLEEDVGTPLFERDKHHVELTAAGCVFLEEARVILRCTHHAIALTRQAARAVAGHLTIGSIVGVEGEVFSRILPLLRIKYPDVLLSLRSLTTPEQIAALLNSEINVGFLRGPIDDPVLASEVVAHENILAVLPAGHALTKLRRIPISMLADVPLIQVLQSGAPAVHDITNRIAEQAGVHLCTALETDNIVATLNAVGSGLGFSLLPDYARQFLPASVVARPLDVDPPPVLDLLVAYRKDDKHAVLAGLISILREYISRPRRKNTAE